MSVVQQTSFFPLWDRRGSVSVMMALFATVLVGFAALALDVGAWEVDQSAMQGAADQAALAAGYAMQSGATAAIQEAKGVAAAHGYVDQTDDITVTVNIPPVTGAYAGTKGAIAVIIRHQQPQFLSHYFLPTAPVASARAVVVPSPGDACIMALTPSGSGLTNNGNATIASGPCNIYVNSNSDCGASLSGSAVVTGYDIFLGQANPCLSGGATMTATDRIVYDAPPILDPYASRTMPTPATPCTKVSNAVTQVLSPGTYCGLNLSGHPDVTLSNGVYIFTGNVSLSGGGSITGTNVTVVMTNGASLSLSGSSSLTLTALSSGPTAGMALWFDKNSTGTLAASGTTPLNITGVVYAPNANLAWTGNVHSPCTQLVAASITLSGNANFSHDGCGSLGVQDPVGAEFYRLLE